MFKIMVYAKGRSVHRYDFVERFGAWQHFEMYKREVQDGFYLSCELWKRAKRDVVATGLPGEIIWELVERYNLED